MVVPLPPLPPVPPVPNSPAFPPLPPLPPAASSPGPAATTAPPAPPVPPLPTSRPPLPPFPPACPGAPAPPSPPLPNRNPPRPPFCPGPPAAPLPIRSPPFSPGSSPLLMKMPMKPPMRLPIASTGLAAGITTKAVGPLVARGVNALDVAVLDAGLTRASATSAPGLDTAAGCADAIGAKRVAPDPAVERASDAPDALVPTVKPPPRARLPPGATTTTRGAPVTTYCAYRLLGVTTAARIGASGPAVRVTDGGLGVGGGSSVARVPATASTPTATVAVKIVFFLASDI